MGVLKKILFDFVYPEKEKCFICGKDILLSEVPFLCSDCLEDLSYTSNICNRCGREIGVSEGEKEIKNGVKKDLKCEFCSKNSHDFYFKKNRSAFIYEKLGRELIFHFKYFNKKELYLPLGELLYIYFKEYYSQIDFDYILAIPLYKSRKKERGYNQAKLLAEVVAQKSGIELLKDILIRYKKTPPLYDLNRSKREALIRGVFKLKKNNLAKLKGKNILLIDDIFTTGTTTNEASFVLKKEGKVNKVYTLTLATARV